MTQTNKDNAQGCAGTEDNITLEPPCAVVVFTQVADLFSRYIQDLYEDIAPRVLESFTDPSESISDKEIGTFIFCSHLCAEGQSLDQFKDELEKQFSDIACVTFIRPPGGSFKEMMDNTLVANRDLISECFCAKRKEETGKLLVDYVYTIVGQGARAALINAGFENPYQHDNMYRGQIIKRINAQDANVEDDKQIRVFCETASNQGVSIVDTSRVAYPCTL